jgi:hypothetical protein
LTLSRNLRHFFKNILLPGPECLRSTSWWGCWGLRIFIRESWDSHFFAALGALFSVPRPNVAYVEASTETLRTLYQSGENHFEGISTGDKSWFQYSDSYPSSKMFARSPTYIIPRTQQAIGAKKPW